MFRFPLLAVLLVASLNLEAATGCTTRPNVVVVALSGVWAKAPTPQLDRVTKRGIRFKEGLREQPAVAEAYFSLLTGFSSGAGTIYDRPEISLAHQLERHGYRTFLVNGHPQRSVNSGLGAAFQTRLDVDAGEVVARVAQQATAPQPFFGMVIVPGESRVAEADRTAAAIAAALEEKQLLDSTIVVYATVAGGDASRQVTRLMKMAVLLPPCYGVEPQVVSKRANPAGVARMIYELAGIDAMPLWNSVFLAPAGSATQLLRSKPAVALPILSTSVLHVPGGFLDDRAITVLTPRLAEAKRKALVQYIWGDRGFPADTLPAIVTCDIPNPVGELPGLERIDELRMPMAEGETGLAWHFIADEPNGEVTIVHQGHNCAPFNDPTDGIQQTIAHLLSQGTSVVGVFMPHQQPGDCRPAPHDAMFAQPPPIGSPFRFFVEPVVVVLNYLERRAIADGFPQYYDIQMVGLSGGGWTGTLAAAIDPRIRQTVSISASLPIYLRRGNSLGDIEQFDPGLYRLASYLDLYILSAHGPGRRHVQVLNRYDSCCFGEAQHEPGKYDSDIRAYERRVQTVLASLGDRPTAFRVVIDDHATTHRITAEGLESALVVRADEGRTLVTE